MHFIFRTTVLGSFIVGTPNDNMQELKLKFRCTDRRLKTGSDTLLQEARAPISKLAGSPLLANHPDLNCCATADVLRRPN